MSCSHQFEYDCHECRAEHEAIAAAEARHIQAGDRVRMRGERWLGTVNEISGPYAFVSWDGACTRRDPISWLERV